MAQLAIRVAEPSDWPQIWPFFAQIVEAEETYAYPRGLTIDTGRAIWMEPEPSRVTVAVLDGVIVGSAKAGPNRPGAGSHVATAAFMVDPAHAGKGIGRALAEDALAWATAEGYRSMQFNAVVETNTGAVHLWQSLGFEILATVPEAFDHSTHGLVGLHIMYRQL